MRYLLVVIAVVVSLHVTAQSTEFSVETNDTTLAGDPVEHTFYGDIDIYNDAASAFTINWEVIDSDLPTNWEISNCDPNVCHPIGTTSGSFTLTVWDGYLNTHFYPNGEIGEGTIDVKLWTDSHPEDSIVLTYRGVAGNVGIEDETVEDLIIFPTLSSDKVYLLNANPEKKATITVYNALGKLVQSYEEIPDHIDVQSLSPGHYFIEVDNGMKRSLHRFVRL